MHSRHSDESNATSQEAAPALLLTDVELAAVTGGGHSGSFGFSYSPFGFS